MSVLEGFWDIILFLFPELTTALLPPLFRTVLEISLTMTVIIAALLLLRPLLQKHYRAKWMYWVWLLVAVRLAVPFNLSLPQAPVSLMAPSTTLYQVYAPEGSYRAWESPEALPTINQVTPPEGVGGPAVDTPHTPVARIYTLSQVAVLVWSMGVCAVLLWEGISYARFRRRVRRWRSAEQDGGLLGRFEELKAELGVKNITLARCSAISSPMVTGFLRPALLLPEAGAPEAVLRHELIHAKRHDLWYKLLLVFVRALHWFNPLVWLMARQAGQDMELSCDEAVVAGRDEGFRAGYGKAILSAMESGQAREQAPLTTYFHSGKRAMLERLQSIVNTKAKRRGVVALSLAAVLTLVVSAACAITPPTQKVEGGIYTLSIPTDIISCTRTEVMPDDTFPTSYYETHFWRYSGSGIIRRLSIPGFADMSFEERAEALRPTDKALGEFEFFNYTSPGGLVGMEAESDWQQVYSFHLGGDGVLQFWLSLGAKGTGHHGAYFTQAEADAMLASLMIGDTPIPNSTGTRALSAGYLNDETRWYLWDTAQQNPVLLDTVSVPAEPRVIGGVLWSQDGRWAAVPSSSEGGPARDFQVLRASEEGLGWPISTLFHLGGGGASLFAASGVTLDYTPIPETLELRVTEFVETAFPYPTVRVNYSWQDTAGGLQSGSFTYPCYPPETSYRPIGHTDLTDIAQNAPYIPTRWSDEIHTFSLPLPEGTAISPTNGKEAQIFTGPDGEELGRIYKTTERPEFSSSGVRIRDGNATYLYSWQDHAHSLYYHMELHLSNSTALLPQYMAEALTVDGTAVDFY